MTASPRHGAGGEMATPIFPNTPVCGRPGRREISVQVSPKSVLLKSPLPGPPEDICQDFRNASHNAAYIAAGWPGSRERSTPPVLSSRYRTLRQVSPPLVDLKIPRSALG